MQVDGQTAVSYDYDNANRLTGVTQGTTAVTLAYDNANRRTSLTLPNGVVTEYTYDNVSQLTGLTYKLAGTPFGDLAYAYDANGQRTAVTGSYARSGLPAALTSATYDDANQIETFGGTTFSYDDNGRRRRRQSCARRIIESAGMDAGGRRATGSTMRRVGSSMSAPFACPAGASPK
jgi:YD repeat-containing protein